MVLDSVADFSDTRDRAPSSAEPSLFNYVIGGVVCIYGFDCSHYKTFLGCIFNIQEKIIL